MHRIVGEYPEPDRPLQSHEGEILTGDFNGNACYALFAQGN